MKQKTSELVSVPLDAVIVARNDREVFSAEALRSLADDIAAHGIIQPPTYRPVGDGTYEIVAGERRTRAAKLLGWKSIDAFIREMSDEEASELMFIENNSRVELSPMEEARGFRHRRESFGWSEREMAERLGVSESLVKSRLQLLELHPEVQGLVESGNLPLSVANEISRLNHDYQRRFIQWYHEQPDVPTSRAMKQVAVDMYASQAQAALFDASKFQLEEATAEVVKRADGNLRNVLPTCIDVALPTTTASMAVVIDRYLCELLAQGETGAAEVIADFWCKLQESNYAVLAPADSRALKSHPDFFAEPKEFSE